VCVCRAVLRWGPRREGATKIFVAIYKQTGDILKDKMLAGMKSATADPITKLFAALPAEEVGMGKHKATRSVKGAEPAKAVSLDELVPRVDLSKKVSEKTLKKLEEKTPKARKEAVDELIALLAECNHRIGPKDGDIFSAIKPRYVLTGERFGAHRGCELLLLTLPPVSFAL
jgi:hypothetical protein